MVDEFDVLGHRRARLVERRDQWQRGSFPRQLCSSASWDRQRGKFTFINAVIDVFRRRLHYPERKLNYPMQTCNLKKAERKVVTSKLPVYSYSYEVKSSFKINYNQKLLFSFFIQALSSKGSIKASPKQEPEEVSNAYSFIRKLLFGLHFLLHFWFFDFFLICITF